MSKIRSMRVIEQLRSNFPGKWSYNHQERRWEHEDGWYVDARAMMAPRYDGDDEHFTTQYYRSDTGEPVWIATGYLIFNMKGAQSGRLPSH